MTMLKKFLLLTLMMIFSLTLYAEHQHFILSEKPRYWGQYISQKALGEIVMLQNNDITFFSHNRCRKFIFSSKDNCLEYKIKNRVDRIFYDPSTKGLYKTKPGKLFFIPAKIIFVPITDQIAENQIRIWQK